MNQNGFRLAFDKSMSRSYASSISIYKAAFFFFGQAKEYWIVKLPICFLGIIEEYGHNTLSMGQAETNILKTLISAWFDDRLANKVRVSLNLTNRLIYFYMWGPHCSAKARDMKTYWIMNT